MLNIKFALNRIDRDTEKMSKWLSDHEVEYNQTLSTYTSNMDAMYQRAHDSALNKWKGKIEDARLRGYSREHMLETFKKESQAYWGIRNEFVTFTESEKDRIGKEIMDKIYQDISYNFGGGGGKTTNGWSQQEVTQSVNFFKAYIETEVYAWGEHNKRVFREGFFDQIEDTIYLTGADHFQLTAWFMDHEDGYIKDMDSYSSDMDNMYQGALESSLAKWKAKITDSLKQGFS
jgi:hypothetical protein